MGMSGKLVGCEGIYRFIISSGMSGLLDILKNRRCGDIFLGMGILVIFLCRVYVLWIMARVPTLGGSDVVNCMFSS